MDATLIEQAIAALRAGEPVLLPTDTVYALCASPFGPEPAERLYALKGRGQGQPMAIIAASIDTLFELVPELLGRDATLVRELLPGPYTLVLGNPSERFRWLNGSTPAAIGVRVAELPGPVQQVLDAVGAIAATSANDPGGPSPTRLAEVPERIRAACGAAVDLGPLPGVGSTVIDFTADTPVVLREGAAPSAGAIARALGLGRTPGEGA
jgi:tRNA threonylcarbamoyl adenosine modification protein (Sua5/YciO/YrdC/YwlC family)